MARIRDVQFAARMFDRQGGWHHPDFQNDWIAFISVLRENMRTLAGSSNASQGGAGGTGSAGGGGGSPPASTSAHASDSITVLNTASLMSGDLVSFRGSTLAKADCTTNYANFAVAEIRGNLAVLVKSWAKGRLRIDTSRGTSLDGRLWLSRLGKATDEENDIENLVSHIAEGESLFKQHVGNILRLAGEAPTPGLVVCDLNLWQPYEMLGG